MRLITLLTILLIFKNDATGHITTFSDEGKIIPEASTLSSCNVDAWPNLNFEKCLSNARNPQLVSNHQLTSMLVFLNKKLETGTANLSKTEKNFIFEFGDLIIRRAAEDVGLYNMIKENLPTSNNMKIDLKYLLPKYSYFHPLIDKSHNQYRYARDAEVLNFSHPNKDDLKNHKILNVFHVSFEANNLRVGGVGPYIGGLVKSENQAKSLDGKRLMHSSTITPCYDVLVDRLFGQLQFVGMIPHEIDGKVFHSTIYLYFDSDVQGAQYLIKADPSYKNGNIQKINTPGELYKNFTPDQWLYFSSAVSAFATSFKGNSGNDNIDVLQINTWQLGLITPLMDLIYNPIRERALLPKVTTIATTHELNGFQGQESSSLYSRVGLFQPDGPTINLQATFNLHADMSNTVSEAVANEMATVGMGYGLEHIFQHLKEIGRFRGITNGIDVSAHAPNENNLGVFQVKPPYGDLWAKKQAAKEFLYQNNIIGDPNKPLILYVGRFSEEKGIDVFVPLIEEALKQNAQVVIMGQAVNNDIQGYIDSLKARYNNPEIRIYDNVARDQIASINDTKIRKGHLIRFAADFTMVPSIEEACGLVPIEAMAVGSMVITSYVHGLKDLIIPRQASACVLPQKKITSSHFTGYTFQRDPDFEKTAYELRKQLYLILNEWRTLSDESKQELSIKLIDNAQLFGWLTPSRGVFKYYEMYLDAMKPLSSDQLQKVASFNNEHFPPNDHEKSFIFNDALLRPLGSLTKESLMSPNA